VTGSSGFLGRACADALAGAGHEVIGVDATPSPDKGLRSFTADLRDPYAIHRVFDDIGGAPDALVHLANHATSHAAPEETILRENLAMNSAALLGAMRAGTRRLVFASSVQAMLGGIMRGFHGGEPLYPSRLPISEDVEPAPSTTYGLSKLMTELMLTHLTAGDRFEAECSAVSLRLPYLLSDRAFNATAQRTGPAEYHWGGPEAFAYVHVADAAEAMRLACETELTGHQVFWIAAPDPRPAESVESLVDRFYGEVPGSSTAAARGSLMDASRAERMLGWKARRTLAEARAGAASA